MLNWIKTKLGFSKKEPPKESPSQKLQTLLDDAVSKMRGIVETEVALQARLRRVMEDKKQIEDDLQRLRARGDKDRIASYETSLVAQVQTIASLQADLDRTTLIRQQHHATVDQIRSSADNLQISLNVAECDVITSQLRADMQTGGGEINRQLEAMSQDVLRANARAKIIKGSAGIE